MSFRALFYIEQDYAFDILRPLQIEINAHGGTVYWFLAGDAVDATRLQKDELSLPTVREVIALNPDAVFAPGDRVPGFFPGLKVQVFHGLNEDKRGNVYPERGLFDLYCTEGPGRTTMLEHALLHRQTFTICETGWLKLDTLLKYRRSETTGHNANSERPVILFASTFTPDFPAPSEYSQPYKHSPQRANGSG